MTFVLRVEQARRSFGATAALQGLDLSLRRGEWLALLGPNGAGKTTLVRAMGEVDWRFLRSAFPSSQAAQ